MMALAATAASPLGAPPQPAAAPTPLELLAEWHLHPTVSAALLLSGVAYLAASRRTRRAWSRARTGAFLGGLALLAVALQSGLDGRAGELLSVHMVQHLVLTLLAPPLLLLGAPVTLALQTLGGRARAALGRVVAGRAVAALTSPVLAWTAFAGVLVATHLTALYDAAVGDPALHALEHALFLVAALVFWSPVAGADPRRHRLAAAPRILYLLLAMPPMALVGVALSSGADVRYGAYLEPAHELGIGALGDQQLAGAIMWVGGGLVLVAATLAGGWVELVREERRAAAREAYADAAETAGAPR